MKTNKDKRLKLSLVETIGCRGPQYCSCIPLLNSHWASVYTVVYFTTKSKSIKCMFVFSTVIYCNLFISFYCNCILIV